MKGCLMLLAVFFAAFGLESLAVEALNLPHAWIPALMLATGLTLLIGSFQGVQEAWRTRAAPETNPLLWRDGQTVRIGGVLRAMGPLARAPFSGREVLLLGYKATAQHWREMNRQSRPSFWGMALAPCSLQTASGNIALTGLPRFADLPEMQFSDEEQLERAANHLANTAWAAAPDILSFDFDTAHTSLSGDTGQSSTHLINRLARQALGMDEGPASVEQYRQRMKQQGWLLRERVLAADTEVTVLATYRANPPRLDVAYGPATARHAITPGSAARTAARDFGQTLIFVLILALLTAAGHYLVFHSGGALYRELLLMAPG
ncbi:hypothetical protein NP590_02520 [Methylomonas sp. SURF-2]|uniref:RING-type E3 ubiquitin transferase n=1 Tax=Methylomonas subterranea TaxID=2952225 RepID=A0ABT1TBY8_9GAMM|nr:hypothetical protein [Methylomonas sp. SURF-2]MCQ8102968.1 hypothetical protein [Methylomonas sp. SURF-2]